MTDEDIAELNLALNEARWLAVDVVDGAVAVTVRPLWLPAENERVNADNADRLSLVLAPANRLCASLRDGRWNDPAAPVLPLRLEDLGPFVESAPSDIYGDMFDLPDEAFDHWKSRVSLDVRWRPGVGHSLYLFANRGPVHLDLLLWFDAVEIQDARGGRLSAAELGAGARRWWTALYAKDPRTTAAGILPLAPPSPGRP